jgi:hypothetical protein
MSVKAKAAECMKILTAGLQIAHVAPQATF